VKECGKYAVIDPSLSRRLQFFDSIIFFDYFYPLCGGSDPLFSSLLPVMISTATTVATTAALVLTPVAALAAYLASVDADARKK
jgi:hypothetical protein